MFGGAFFKILRPVRETVGIYPSAHGIAFAYLCAPEDGAGTWTVTELRRAPAVWTEEDGAAPLAALVREELSRMGRAHLPLALALPAAEAEVRTVELPAALTGEELHKALLWALRASADERDAALPEETCLCYTVLPEASVHRCRAAALPAARVREIFSAFAQGGLSLRRLTVCPADGGELAERISAARMLGLPWERTDPVEEAAVLPAVYAGLLFCKDTPGRLYLTGGMRPKTYLRRYAAAALAVLSAAAFLGVIAAEAGAYMTVLRERDRVREELALHAADRRRMEEYMTLRADTVRRERLLTAFLADSLPWRAVLVHLGSVTEDGIRFLSVASEGHTLRMEGEAAHYEALASMMSRLQAGAFFTGGVRLERAAQERGAAEAPARIRFVLRADW